MPAVLYVVDVVTETRIRAWRPEVDGVAEVFHADFAEHAYPSHTHDTWTLLIVDDGVVRYDLDRHEHGAVGRLVTLLPPHVPHDGRSVTSGGFRKRVLYLEPGQLSPELIGQAVDRPELADAGLRRQIDRLHQSLALPGEDLESQSRLALVLERLTHHLRGVPDVIEPDVIEASRPGVAAELRGLLDASVADGVGLGVAARIVGVTPAHLVRTFTAAYGLPPHRYLIGRRIDLARRMLLDGARAGEVATAVGFFDQAHLTRHFRRMVGTTPGRYVAAGDAA
ncbi:MAG: AraC family transcriptional regulator [Propionibacteriales bacterium]|nr:AraC family transcriptional regulator [Propionibacteriales bacterium]